MRPGAAAPFPVRLVREGLSADRSEGFVGRSDVRMALRTKDRHEAGSNSFEGTAGHGKRGGRLFALSTPGDRFSDRELFRRVEVDLRDRVPARAKKNGGARAASVYAGAEDGGPKCASVMLTGGPGKLRTLQHERR